ncbi:MAG: hypothetical protein DCF25_00030 [Leptolyngbya foveolarum]|uniref:Uncharacterized protein n=1 Tax=Leptolyngbya foveolarum TaxID=47253 RepID=A0A2W4URI4_9CYAN|nr:MAG: hypothetical protein DCF25_00030 [Leptolyngbya foveolarum]
MSLSSLSKPIAHQLAHPLLTLCKRWNWQPEDIKAGALLWISWTGSTWLAFALSLLFIEIGETGEVSWLEAALGGTLVGAGQWFVLRPHLRHPARWMIATVTSWILLGLLHLGSVGWAAPGTPSLLLRSVSGVLYGSYLGLGLGLGQWWVLRSQVNQAWRWIPLSAGIWGTGIAFAWLIGGLLRTASGLFLGEVVGLLVGWGAISALSGIGIVGLLYGDQQGDQPNLYLSKRALAAAKSNAFGSKSPY